MVFSSTIFIFGFLPLLVLVYFVARDEARNYVLLLFSLIFYAWGGPKFLLVMVAVVLIDYVMAIGIEYFKRKSYMAVSRACLLFSIISNIGVLIFYKYTKFFLENIKLLLNCEIVIPNIILPIGISFFTFQALSYVIDVYKKDADVQKNFFYLLLYVSLFPQLVAGPIVRYKTVDKEIAKRSVTQQDIVDGIERFILGFAKKVILANKLGELADSIYNSGDNLFTLTAWLAAAAYMLQIYFDFSAYSDMAIGLGRIFGFHFMENFNFPYISKSVTEFWRRWHISLSTWFRDYIYIPLGGNRCGKGRWFFNLFVVWLLTGIWHGASWNFILWGLYYFIFLIFEKVFLGRFLNKLPSCFQHLYTLFIIFIGWILFRIESLQGIMQMFRTMFSFKIDEVSLNLVSLYLCKYGIYLVAAIIFSVPIHPYFKTKISAYLSNYRTMKISVICIYYGMLLVLFYVTVLYLINSTYNPFIYFRF